MSDTSQDDWATDVAPPPKKKGLPSWLLFCGGGCLIFFVLAVIGIFLLVDSFKDMANPEAQWSALEESIPMDARPNEMRMAMGFSIMGTETWTMAHDSGYMVMIIKNDGASQEEREEVFGGNAASAGIPGLSEINEPSAGTVMVQGRDLPVARFKSQSMGQGAQQGCFVDITPEGEAGMVLFYIFTDGRSKGDTAVTDEFVTEILKPFLIGPDRQIYAPSGPHPQLGKTSMDLENAFQAQIKNAESSTAPVEIPESVEEPIEEDE